MESPSFMQGVVSGFQQGGTWMIPIAIAFAISIAFSFERFTRLFLQYNVDGASFMFEVQKYILANDLDGAIRLCNGAGRAALPKVIKAGLQRASRDETIHSFAAVALADPAQRQAILATGIAEAMNCTAFGLVTAIFTMIAHSILSNKSTKILEEIDEFGVKLLDLLSARKFRHSSEKE